MKSREQGARSQDMLCKDVCHLTQEHFLKCYCGPSAMMRLWESGSSWWVEWRLEKKLEDEWVWQVPQCYNRPGTLKRAAVSLKVGTGALEIWFRLALWGQPLLFFLAQCQLRTGMSDMTVAYCWESLLEIGEPIPTACFTVSLLTSYPEPFL